MHLPKEVQMVALSATLKDPEKFLGWIGSTRGRPGELVRRTDRHVPLHVGFLERKKGAFVEFFGTHGERASTFDMVKFAEMKQALTTPAVVGSRDFAEDPNAVWRTIDIRAVAADRVYPLTNKLLVHPSQFAVEAAREFARRLHPEAFE